MKRARRAHRSAGTQTPETRAPNSGEGIGEGGRPSCGGTRQLQAGGYVGGWNVGDRRWVAEEKCSATWWNGGREYGQGVNGVSLGDNRLSLNGETVWRTREGQGGDFGRL